MQDDQAITTPRIDQPAGETQIAAMLLLVGVALSIICGRIHPDGILHFDDLTHYLFARWAWTWPAYLLHDWGRPGFTVLYFLPAALGWGACRILSALLTAASAWLAFRLAQSWRIPAAWAVIPLCYAQPLFFQLSQTTLTETPLAFYLIASIYAANKNRWTLCAAILSLAFITRHEAIVFLPVFLFFAWRSGQIRNSPSAIRYLLLLLWAPILTNALQWIFGVTPTIKLLLTPQPTTQYGRGGWLTYFSRSLEAFGPGIMVLAMAGIFTLWNYERRIANGELKTCKPHYRYSLFAIINSSRYVVSIVAAYFLIQTTLRALGLYASGGYARFLVPISPMIALCALAGWHALKNGELRMANSETKAARPSLLRYSQFAIRHSPPDWAALTVAASMLLLWIAMERQIVLYNQSRDELAEMPQVHHAKLAIRIAAAVIVVLYLFSIRNPKSKIQNSLLRGSLLILILLAPYALAGPLKPPPEAALINDLRHWLYTHGYQDRPILSANVWIDYAFDQELPPDRPATPRRLDLAAPGTLFIWDRKFAPDDDHRLPLGDLLRNPGWRPLDGLPPPVPSPPPELAVFEKITS